MFLPSLPPRIGDDYSDLPRSAQNPTPQSEFLLDGSGALFSMYSRMGEKEDDKIAELWRKDADGILIFVSPRVVCTRQVRQLDIIDWIILHGRCNLPYGILPGPQTNPATFIRILSREDLSPSW
jgi:hypothetical protein